MSSRQPSSSSSKTKAAATGRRRKKANSVTIAAKEAELAALEAALAEIDKDDQQKEQIKQLALETKQDRQGRKLGILPKAKGRAETGGKEPEDDPMDVERPKVHGSGELGAGEARLQSVPVPPSPAPQTPILGLRSPTPYSQPGPSTSQDEPATAGDRPSNPPRQRSIARNDGLPPPPPNTAIAVMPVNPATAITPPPPLIRTTPPIHLPANRGTPIDLTSPTSPGPAIGRTTPITPIGAGTPTDPTTPVDLTITTPVDLTITTLVDPATPTTAMLATSMEVVEVPGPIATGEKRKDGKRKRGEEPTRSNTLMVNVDRNTQDISAIRVEMSGIRTELARISELLERMAPPSSLPSDEEMQH